MLVSYKFARQAARSFCSRPIPPRASFLRALKASLVALGVAGIFVVGLPAQEPASGKGSAIHNTQPGQRTFAATCAGCHGLDGNGGERGPNIAGSAKLQRLTDADLSGIVSNGLPGTGMPAFRSLGASQLRAVVSYLRVLQGQNKTQELPGDPVHGEAIFFGKAECSSCHMVRGKGGFLGPDLSTYGGDRSAKEILDDITNSAKNPDTSQQIVAAVTSDGHQIKGLVRNEDNFSVQLLTADGNFYFLRKSELQSLEYKEGTVMPPDYGQRLSSSELNDLAAYLMNIGRTAKPVPAMREED
jgi:cytochrome c oxidase cbb3-type subunit III